MIKRIAILVVILSLFLSMLPISALAIEWGNGTVEGSVVNQTAGGASVADLDVSLNTQLDGADVASTTTRTDAEGRFTFNGLSTEPGYSYQIKLVYQGAEYYSDWLSFDEGQTTKSVEVTVYDSTTSDEALWVATSHMIVYIGEETLLVKEYYLFVNRSDRAYIGPNADGGGETLKFFLPEEATEFQATLGLMSCCIVTDKDGFHDTMAVLPGGKEVAYSYKVAYGSGSYALSRMINYPIANFDLLVQGESIEVADDKLTTGEPLDIKGDRFTHLSGGNFVRGDVVVTRLIGLPVANDQGVVKWVAIALAVLTGSFTLFLRTRRLQPARAGDNIDRRTKKLLVELARLDDALDDGKIQPEAYRTLRAEKKARLVELMQETKEGGIR